MHFTSSPALPVEQREQPLIILKIMKLFSALGLGIAIIVLKLLMSDVFSAFENTLLSLFDFSQHMVANADQAVSNMDFKNFAVPVQ